MASAGADLAKGVPGGMCAMKFLVHAFGSALSSTRNLFASSLQPCVYVVSTLDLKSRGSTPLASSGIRTSLTKGCRRIGAAACLSCGGHCESLLNCAAPVSAAEPKCRARTGGVITLASSFRTPCWPSPNSWLPVSSTMTRSSLPRSAAGRCVTSSLKCLAHFPRSACAPRASLRQSVHPLLVLTGAPIARGHVHRPDASSAPYFAVSVTCTFEPFRD